MENFDDMVRRIWGEPSKDKFSWTTNLNQLLADWCSKRFANPLDAVEALRRGENQEEASASLFWYCYSSLDDFSGEFLSFMYKFWRKQIDETVFHKAMNNIGTFKSQMAEIVNNFTLDNIKYPNKRESYVGVLVGAALIIILISQKKKLYKDTRELINRVHDFIGHIPVGEPGYELWIGIVPLETKKIRDNEYSLSGSVVEFLSLLACVTIWDSYANSTAEQKDYRTSFVTYVKTLDCYWTSLYGSLKKVAEAVLYDVSFQLPYSSTRISDENYLNSTVELWELVKVALRKPEDWEEMGGYLKTFKFIVKGYYSRKTETSGGFVIESSDIEVSEIADYIDGEIAICESASKQRGTPLDEIETFQKQLHKRIIMRYFFPKGLHNSLEKGTSGLLFNAEDEWWEQRFFPMANYMRQALEVEIIATLPFLEFLKEKDKKDKRLLATLIADALMNDEANASIDTFSNKAKPTQILLKKTLPGFIKKLVQVRNYYDKDKHIVGKSREDPKKMRDSAEEVHKIFFGIDCEGVFPFLIRIKRDDMARRPYGRNSRPSGP